MIFSLAGKDSSDRRKAPRQTCSHQAIVLPGQHPCTVVDRSGGGLRLRFRRPYDGPSDLVVVLVDSGLSFTASTRWNRDGEVGALITAQCDLNGLVPGAFAGAREVWRRLKGTDRPYNREANEP